MGTECDNFRYENCRDKIRLYAVSQLFAYIIILYTYMTRKTKTLDFFF